MSAGALDASDFETVFRALLPRAKRVAFRILGNETDAEDAAAEAFARAHASWRRVSRLPYRDAWVLRVTANVAIDMARRRRPQPPGDDTVDHEDGTVLRLALVTALGTLPRRQREVITLRFLEGLSEAEVAGALRVSSGTVKKAGHRALATLRRELGGHLDEALDVDERGTMPRSEGALLALVYRRSAAIRRRRRAAAGTAVALAVFAVVVATPLARPDHPTGVDMVDTPSPEHRTTAPGSTAHPAEGQPSPEQDEAAPRSTQGRSRAAPTRPDGLRADAPPSGRIVLVGAGQDGTQQHLFTVEVDGTSPRDLGPGVEPRWSPDGQRIAFIGEGLVVMDGDGSDRRPLSLSSAADPRWSPDGTRIAFVQFDADPTSVRPQVVYACPPCVTVSADAQSDIALVDLDTGAITNVTTGSSSEFAPSWSSDGRRIAFARGSVHSVRPDGTDERRHAGGGNLTGVSWSPAGEWIAFTRLFPGEMPDEPALWVAATEHEDVRPVHTGAVARRPVWAPDGPTIAFTHEGSDGAATIRIVRPEGAVITTIRGHDPTFSPDGRHIAYCTESGLWRAERDGSNPVRLMNVLGCHEPDWSQPG